MNELVAAILSAPNLSDAQRVAMLRTAMLERGSVSVQRADTAARSSRLSARSDTHAKWRQRRAESRMTQEGFAEAIGVTIATLRALEGGYRDRRSLPQPERHADAERRYLDWLDRQTRPGGIRLAV